MPTGHASLMPTLRRVVLAGTAADRTDGQLLGAFVADRDADAFGALVRRHGPMVLGVCRRVLADHATADDAFQAVFLVLARRAAAVRPRERVGNWLYGVAYRTALKARAALARRRSREKQVLVMPEPPAAPPRDEWADLRPVLDEELAALPEKLRTPVVLCDLEGRPQREVARALGLPPATLATRLAAARRTLAQRLTRRGVTLSGGVLATLLAAHGAAAAVPVALARALTGAAEAIASGAAYSELVSAGALHLSEGVLRMMTLSKLKALAVAAVVTAALTGGLGLGLAPAHAQGPGTAPAPAARAGAAAPQQQPAPVEHPAVARVRDDIVFLRRVCIDLRGTPPTDIETFFFVTDADEGKRDKLVGWLLAGTDTRAFVARSLAATADRLRVIRPLPEPGGTEALPADVLWQFRAGPGDEGVQLERALAQLDRERAQVQRGLRFLMAVQDGFPTSSTAEPHAGSGRAAVLFNVAEIESDLAFLKRVTAAARGTPPTGLEERYFTEDKDPKKREKLLDSLLKEPAVAKRLGDDFKAKMLAAVHGDVLKTRVKAMQPLPPQQPVPPGSTFKFEKSFRFEVPPGVVLPEFESEMTLPLVPQPAARGDRLGKLIDELLAAKKTDAEVLEAVTLATAGRLPTGTEKRLTNALVAKAADRRAAWLEVAKAVEGTRPLDDGAKFEIELNVPVNPWRPAPPPAKR